MVNENNPCDEINFDDLRNLLSKEFDKQQILIFTNLAKVDIDHKADVDRQIEGYKREATRQIEGYKLEVTKQIDKVHKKIVGWTWVLIIAVIAIIVSITISYIIITNHYDKFLSDVFVKEQRDAERNNKGTTRTIPMPKTDAQIDSAENEILSTIKK
jgi:hypothetical protein